MCRDQRGSSGLETAIVFVTFVVVATVFAFAALSAGQQSNNKTAGIIQASLSETRSRLELKGSVVLTASLSGTSGTVSDIAFQVTNAAGVESIDLTPGRTLIKYTDNTQSKMFTSTDGFTATGLGSADPGKLLEPNEVFLLQLIDLENSFGTGENTLTNKLGPGTTFTIEVISPKGTVLLIERDTPSSLDASMSLR